MNLNLQGKYAVVCGSTQGIGFAAAKELSILGANVILVARNEDKLKQALTLLDSSLNQSHEYLVADFAHPQNLQDVIEKFAANHQIHILVNNTGGPDPGPAIDADIEAFRIAFNSHLICNQIMVRALVPGMKELGYGHAYRYAHDEPEAYAAGEHYFPDEMLRPPRFYQPTPRGLEGKIGERLTYLKSLDLKAHKHEK